MQIWGYSQINCDISIKINIFLYILEYKNKKIIQLINSDIIKTIKLK